MTDVSDAVDKLNRCRWLETGEFRADTDNIGILIVDVDWRFHWFRWCSSFSSVNEWSWASICLIWLLAIGWCALRMKIGGRKRNDDGDGDRAVYTDNSNRIPNWIAIKLVYTTQTATIVLQQRNKEQCTQTHTKKLLFPVVFVVIVWPAQGMELELQ